MSPEQAKGKSLDKRADIWAFGCILYECLTGKRAFDGETVTETLAAILRGDPDWNALPITTPQNIRSVLNHCLEKDKEKRFQSAADVQILIIENGTPSSQVKAVSSRIGWKRSFVIGLVALAIAFIGLAVGWMVKHSSSLKSEIRFSLPNVANIYSPWFGTGYYRQFALSPDGQKLVFVYNGEEQPCLAVRPLDSIEITILDSTNGATMPFWSPDGESIAFFSGFALRRITLATGAVETICQLEVSMGGSWGAKNEIVVAGSKGVWRVTASAGSTPQPIVKRAELESWAFPSFFDDGLRFLCSHWTMNEGWTVEVFNIDSDISEPLIKAHVAEVVGDSIVFLKPNGLFHRLFDHETATLKDKQTRLNAGDDSQGYLIGYTLSETGTLIYQRRAPAQLQWYERNGQPEEVLKLDSSCRSPDLSPDGKMLAVECIEPDVSPIDIIGPRDIWIYDVERDSPIKIPVNRGSESDPVWSPDGTQIFFSSDAWDGKGSDIYRTDPSGSEFECVLDDPGSQWVMGWWPGKNLVYVDERQLGDARYSLRMLEGSKSIELVKEAGDGQIFDNYVLYSSDATGEAQIYVQSLESSQVWNISRQGGHKPRWRPDGKEIFYLSPDQKLMAVPVSWDHGFKPGNPESLFETRIASPEGSGMRNPFAVTKDGKRFVIYVGEDSSSLTIVINAIPQ